MPKARQLIKLFIFILIFCGSAVAFSGDASANEKDDYKKLEIFTDVLSLVRSNYVEDVDMEKLIYGAIRGMLSTLDPHSSFLTPEMYREMEVDTHGEFGGLGIELTVKDGDLIIVSPIEDTPADAAGIQAGDQIVKINGQATRDIEIMEAVRMMRGPKGEAITISVKRSGVAELLNVTIIRDIIQVQSVKSRDLQEHYGYVRVSQFQDRTSRDLKEQLGELRRTLDVDLQGIILDLRNNPGGLLEQAVAVADLFLSEGLIVYTDGREPEAQMTFSAQEEGTEPEYPLIVLINGGSASAAEIVAGALQDHRRAIILGEQSFGKGSVQTIISLDDDSGLRLTTARYFTPLGRSIQALGITPDIMVSQLKNQPLSPAESGLREADLENHFQPLVEQPVENNNSQTESLISPSIRDNQLQRAIDLLKGINILKNNN
ncbi:carboxyl-terminal processing protease [Desulfuromusa kysingii]|uniref:Carboxyl-terminal processing protease n=1 Tax=Desulfuromusa kysingii TaxID=37625 RepID=A0A1H3YR80_9BACT|nr:S41 family peptidase [Desulfuromusa kysingii]SEA13524.1 carboxyl-terminal processing protease [Desulfuromusa kysingii]